MCPTQAQVNTINISSVSILTLKTVTTMTIILASCYQCLSSFSSTASLRRCSVHQIHCLISSEFLATWHHTFLWVRDTAAYSSMHATASGSFTSNRTVSITPTTSRTAHGLGEALALDQTDTCPSNDPRCPSIKVRYQRKETVWVLVQHIAIQQQL